MAGTDDHNNIFDEWLLLHDVLELVAQHCKSTRGAERLVIDRAQKGHFTQCRFEGDYISPRSWGAAYPKIGLYVSVDWDSSSVIYVRGEPTSYAFTLALQEILEGFLPPPLQQMHLVRLAPGEVLSMLRNIGLMPRAPMLGPKAPQPPPEQSPPLPPASSSKQQGPLPAQALSQRKKSERWIWLFDKIDQHPPPKKARQKLAWCRSRYEEMKKDFGANIPWSDADSLRRRLDDALSGRHPRPGKKV
jgi:hypothetical protein